MGEVILKPLGKSEFDEQQRMCCDTAADGLKRVFALIVENEYLDVPTAESLIKRLRDLDPNAVPELTDLAREQASEDLETWVWRLNGRLAAVKPEFRRWVELPF